MESNAVNMKKNTTCNRSKPPPVRNSYVCSKLRNLSLERPAFHSPTETTNRLITMSENPEVTHNMENICALQSSSKEVTECMSGWLTFIQMLKGLCNAGTQLSHCLGALACHSSACQIRAAQCQAMWEQLTTATNAATAVVKNQAVAALQEAHVAPDIDADQIDINQQVVCSGLLTMVNLQYQFSMACCECLSGLADCQCYPPHTEPDVNAVARCYTTRLPPPLQPPQRRWSEAAAGAEGKASESTARRWSMPWKLALPSSIVNDRSRSTTPDSVWHTALASQEDLQDVIALLSCKPPTQTTPHLPGVTLTKAAEPVPRGGSSHRGSWWGEGDELDAGMLASRKSSSSTDCSSCYSLHSRSTSGSEELTHGQRSHLYSIWSGSDLPFIKLPESSENPET